MNRRTMLLSTLATASGILLPWEPRRVYSFAPGGGWPQSEEHIDAMIATAAWRALEQMAASNGNVLGVSVFGDIRKAFEIGGSKAGEVQIVHHASASGCPDAMLWAVRRSLEEHAEARKAGRL